MATQSVIQTHTIVISAFPACGKSYLFKHFNGKPYTMLDSDSSKYSWIYDENGNKTDQRNPNFIEDYMKHIEDNIGKVDVIFVSSHKDVRKALRDHNIKYFIVFPVHDMKEEMLRRMAERGNDEKFIQFQREHFDEFIDEIHQEMMEIMEITPNSILPGLPKNLPCHPIPLSDARPYINNDLIDYLLDNSMGNLSSLYWNYRTYRAYVSLN